MKRILTCCILALFAMAVTCCFAGCNALVTPQGQPTPLVTTATTTAAGGLTISLLDNVKAADRADVGATVNAVAAAVYDAAVIPPDFSALNKLVSQRLATWRSPYAPLVTALVQQILSDAQSQANSQPPTAQQEAALKLVRAAMNGIRLATVQYVPPPTTQPQ